MTTFRNVSGVRLDLPALGVAVDPGDTFTVADEDLATGLKHQTAFEVVADDEPTPEGPAIQAPATPAPEPTPAPTADTSVDFNSSI